MSNALNLRSVSFADGAPIPRQHTADGADTSPPLAWDDPPPGTGSFALICDDPDAPMGTWDHWVLFDLPAGLRGLPAGVRPGGVGRDGSNTWGRAGYGGPSPPPGPAHRYFFTLLALDAPLNLPAGVTKEQVLAAAAGRVVAEGKLMGVYGRPAGGRP